MGEKARCNNKYVRQPLDGQREEPSTFRYLSQSLKVHKRSNSDKHNVPTTGSDILPSSKEKLSRNTRLRLPQVWKSASGSWDTEDDFPKRIVSKSSLRQRAVSATEVVIQNNSVLSSVGVTQSRVKRHKTKPEIPSTERITMLNSPRSAVTKSDISLPPRRSEVGTNEARHTETHRNVSRVSAAYAYLQRVSQRNVSAPPLSWSENRQPARARYSNLARSTTATILSDHAEQDTNTAGNKKAKESRSSSFPVKISSMVRSGFARVISPRASSDSLIPQPAEPVRTQIEPLQPLKIDDIQTSHVLAEVGLFRLSHEDTNRR